MISPRLLIAAGAAALVAGLAATPVAASSPGTDSTPTKTPIKHFVFLLQENHTFDNYFGTRPGVDGLPKNVCMPVQPPAAKPCVAPYHVDSAGTTDLDHGENAFGAQYDHGRMDGFVAAGAGSSTAGQTMSYYDRNDLPYYWNLADQYVLFDRFFSSVAGGSPPNHLYSVTARLPSTAKGDALPANGWGNTLPTIFDRLEAAHVSWKFYVQNYDPRINYRTRLKAEANRSSQVIWVPLLGMSRFIDDKRLASHIVDASEYYTDAASGRLPAVSYIVPAGASEHPPGRVQSGETYVRSLLNELTRSADWPSSAFLLSYDDWGGYYDHVRPPQVDADGYGFRVPALLVSAYARRGLVDHTTLDFTSALKFIEDNWHLRPLAQRDARAANLASAFDFASPPRSSVLTSGSLPQATPRTNRSRVIVYPTYGLALVGTLVLCVVASRRRGRRRLGEA